MISQVEAPQEKAQHPQATEYFDGIPIANIETITPKQRYKYLDKMVFELFKQQTHLISDKQSVMHTIYDIQYNSKSAFKFKPELSKKYLTIGNRYTILNAQVIIPYATKRDGYHIEYAIYKDGRKEEYLTIVTDGEIKATEKNVDKKQFETKKCGHHLKSRHNNHKTYIKTTNFKKHDELHNSS